MITRLHIKHCLLTGVLIPGLAGCALTPPHERPELALPAQWQTRQVSAQTAQGMGADWWRQFGSAELNDLMEQALSANHDLAMARNRIAQARAAVRVMGAAQLPQLEATGSAARNRRDDGTRWVTTSSDQQLLEANYELDLWGGRAAQTQASEARLSAQAYARDALALVLQSEVAATYFQALALKDRQAIARRNLETARQVLALVELRYTEGAASGLELAQQRTAVLNIEAQLPALEQQLRLTEHALAVLLGRLPQDFSVQSGSLHELTLPAVAAGQPSALLERRPDIRRDEAELRAANADIGAARAAFYPSLRLSAAGGLSGLLTSGTGTLASLTSGLLAPIFNGGRLEGELEGAEARRAELVARYGQTVATAFQEVEDALVAVQTEASRTELLSQAAAEAQEAYRLSSIRYEAGAVDLLTVLDSLRTQLQAQDSLVQAELARFTAATRLFKALGGSWASEEPRLAGR